MTKPPTVQAGGFVVSGVAQAASHHARPQAGVMTPTPPVVIYPPDETGARRVRIDGSILGLAYSARDVASLIEWRGGGPEEWTH